MAEPRKTTREALTHTVRLRMTGDDMELVRSVAGSLGVPVSKAMRLMLRRADGGAGAAHAAPIVDEVRDALDAYASSYRQLALAVDRVGANLNQVVRRINAGAGISSEAAAALRDVRTALRLVGYDLSQAPSKAMRGAGIHDELDQIESP